MSLTSTSAVRAVLIAVVDMVVSGVSITEQAGGPMLVQRVIVPGSPVESWTVIGDNDVPVVAIERYLAFLSAVERSPNTVKAYAHNLKDFFVFLAYRAWTGAA